MDEFGVLVQSMGFKPHGKSAPMAELKPKPKSQYPAGSAVRTVASDDTHSLPVDELDGIFRSNSTTAKSLQSPNLFGSRVQYDTVDLESVFRSSSNLRNGGANSDSRNSSGSTVAVDDLLGATPERRAPVDDLFGGIGANSGRKPEKKVHGLDDIMPGFGLSTPSKTKVVMHTKSCPSRSRMPVFNDPFMVFESAVSPPDTSWPFTKPDQDTGKGSSAQSSVDEFGDFVTGGTRSGCKVGEAGTPSNAPNSSVGSTRVVFVDEIFGGGNHPRQSTGGQRRSLSQNSLFDDFFHEEKTPGVRKASSESPIGTPAANVGTDFGSLFGDVTTSSGEFHEIEGEPKERRWARLNRLMRTNTRIAEALAEKTKRDFQSQQEQEEKRRLAETMDNSIKRWASGKEGNIRALLSSLQEVLWPECGWHPVSITDMITPQSVKKVYKKATLCVHPDKVQQKGATIQQKYIAEKVFDLLKEAWSKFSAEELR